MTFDDELTAALRRDLQAAHVGFDAAGAEDMIRAATQSDPLGERRAYAAPLAAAAAVVVIGGGVATFAATRDSGTPTGGGPVAPALCGTASASASAVPPPIYSAPVSAYPSVSTTAAPPLPTIAATEPTPSTSIAPPSTSAVPAPPEATVTVTQVPSSVATASPTAAPTVVPTPVPSTSPTTDGPCVTSEAPTASDLPTAVPSTPRPVPTSSNCSPLDIDPGFSGCIVFGVRGSVATGSGSASFPIPTGAGIPSSSRFIVLTYNVENPGTNTGTVTIEQDNTIIARHLFLAASTSPVLSVDTPIEISTGHPAVVRLSCETTTTPCGVRVLVGARIIQRGLPTETTPVTATATHT